METLTTRQQEITKAVFDGATSYTDQRSYPVYIMYNDESEEADACTFQSLPQRLQDGYEVVERWDGPPYERGDFEGIEGVDDYIDVWGVPDCAYD